MYNAIQNKSSNAFSWYTWLFVVEFSVTENHLTPYSDDSLSPPNIAKCDDSIDVVGVERRMSRPEVT